MKILTSTLLLVVVVLLAACSSSNGNESPTLELPTEPEPGATSTPLPIATDTPPAATATSPAPAPTSTPRMLSEPVQAAVDDLALRLSIPASEIVVVSVTAQTWPNGCLGLGGPTEICTQVVTPGFAVVLEADGVMYSYHTNQNSGVRLDES